MCNSFKIKSLLHKLPLNGSSGKDGIFAEHIFYADSSVCNHLSSLFNVCLMHGKILQEGMQTVIVFDRTNHNLLFAKLIKRNVPMCIVIRLLLSRYRQQTMQVKWGTNYSSPFC